MCSLLPQENEQAASTQVCIHEHCQTSTVLLCVWVSTNPPLNDGKSTTLVISITINCHWLIIASRRVNNIYLAAIAASTAACWASLAAFAAALAAAFSAFNSAALGSFFSTAGAEAATLDDEPLCDITSFVSYIKLKWN